MFEISLIENGARRYSRIEENKACLIVFEDLDWEHHLFLFKAEDKDWLCWRIAELKTGKIIAGNDFGCETASACIKSCHRTLVNSGDLIRKSIKNTLLGDSTGCFKVFRAAEKVPCYNKLVIRKIDKS